MDGKIVSWDVEELEWRKSEKTGRGGWKNGQ